MRILSIPPGVKTLELTNATVWFDGEILFSAPAPGKYVQLSRQQMDDEFSQLRSFVGNRKVCVIAETHPIAEAPRKEDRDYISEQLNTVIKALAIVAPNAVSKMIMNLFFLFKPPLYPTKMFVSAPEAKKWLGEGKF